MSDYKRFVSYLYEYIAEKKSENRGYVKVELRSGICRMQFQLNVFSLPEKSSVSVYGFLFPGSALSPSTFFIGELRPGRSGVSGSFSFPARIAGTAFSVSDFNGLILTAPGGKFYGTQWDETPIVPGSFRFNAPPANPSGSSAPAGSPSSAQEPSFAPSAKARTAAEAKTGAAANPEAKPETAAETVSKPKTPAGAAVSSEADPLMKAGTRAQITPPAGAATLAEPNTSAKTGTWAQIAAPAGTATPTEPNTSMNAGTWAQITAPTDAAAPAEPNTSMHAGTRAQITAPAGAATPTEPNTSMHAGTTAEAAAPMKAAPFPQTGTAPRTGTAANQTVRSDAEAAANAASLDRTFADTDARAAGTAGFSASRSAVPPGANGQRPNPTAPHHAFQAGVLPPRSRRPVPRPSDGSPRGLQRPVPPRSSAPGSSSGSLPFSQNTAFSKANAQSSSAVPGSRAPHPSPGSASDAAPGAQITDNPSPKSEALGASAVSKPSQTVSGPSQTASGPSQTASGPSQIVSEPSQTVSRLSQTVSEPSQTAPKAGGAGGSGPRGAASFSSGPLSGTPDIPATGALNDELHIASAEPARRMTPWENIRRSFPPIQPFGDGLFSECVKITPQDLPALRTLGFAVGCNQFMLHGFRSHRHLLLGRYTFQGRSGYVLGVPGLYNLNEQFMASMFGFSGFCPAPLSESYGAPGKTGYWYRLLN